VTSHGFGNRHAAPADNATNTGHEFVGAGAIVRIDENDFDQPIAHGHGGQGIGVPEANHVFGAAKVKRRATGP
jgi:hypothetical protein